VKDLGINGTKSEPLFLNLMMAALDKDGRCAVVVPDGVLVNNSKQHNMTREYLLDNFELKRVIKMKGQFFSNTGIQPSILFFENTGFSTSEVEFWEVEQDSKGVIVENMLLSVPRDTLDESCCLDMRRYQEVAAVVNKGGYPMVKLGDLVEIEGGDYITKSSETTGEYPVYGGGAASYHINRFNREPTCVINKDGMSASCVQMVNTRFFLNHHGWTLKLKSADLVEKFLHWQLYSRSDEIFTLATGSCQKGLNQKEFTQFMIYIPPLPIQQEIVTALDLIYNNAATAKAAAASVKSQMAAVVRSVGARGFERKKLEDVASLKQGFPFKSADYISVGEGLYVLKHNNLQDGVVELSKNQDCIASSENTTNYLLKKGDVVVSMDFDCGKVGKIVNDGWVLNQRMSLLRANLQYLSQDYLYWELLLGKFHEDMTNVNTGTTIKHISGKNISEAMITLPPLFIQHEILAILNEMEAELAMLEQMAANAEQRAKFILDGYLTPAE
jgi:restriction endonuclease S subunit